MLTKPKFETQFTFTLKYGEDIKEKIKWLKWIMDFSNIDLGQLNTEEKQKYIDKALYFGFFGGGRYDQSEDKRVIELLKKRWNREETQEELMSEFIQETIKKFLELILLQVETEKGTFDYEGESRVLFGLMLGYQYRPLFFVYPKKFKLEFAISSQEPEPPDPLVVQQVYGKLYLYSVDDVLAFRNDKDSAIIMDEPEYETPFGTMVGLDHPYGIELDKEAKKGANIFLPEEIKSIEFIKLTLERQKKYGVRVDLIQSLCVLFDNIPVTWIRRCEGCEKYFLHTTTREKRYCTPHCALRSVARKRYEEIKRDPKKYEPYLEYHRRLSRERYKEIRRKQYGPKVKIQKRNNNHRKED